MKILILGGTGAMGIHLVELLKNTDNNIVITSRIDRKSNYDNIKYVVGNAKDNVFLSKLLIEDWDVIIDFMVYITKDFEKRVNILLDSTSQYIFLSSSRVYAESNEPIKESSSRLLDVS